MERYTSPPLTVPAEVRDALYRADLIFEDIDHTGVSFEARVFFDNAAAGVDTPRDPASGYAGSFTVFGHSNCVGDDGHCDPRARYTDVFDLRGRHPLTPITKVVIVTDAVRRLTAGEVSVTVVVVVPGPEKAGTADVLFFDRLRLTTYDSLD